MPSSFEPSPFTPTPQGVRVRVRLTPKASADRIDGVRADAAGGVALKVAVTAVPEDGRANAALIALLAKAWRVPKTAITLVAGAGNRNKTLLVAGDPQGLLPILLGALESPRRG
ncbi:MAG: DUF167 family protein [Pseudomonadota bacterium]